jgi:hypothetical protein
MMVALPYPPFHPADRTVPDPAAMIGVPQPAPKSMPEW